MTEFNIIKLCVMATGGAFYLIVLGMLVCVVLHYGFKHLALAGYRGYTAAKWHKEAIAEWRERNPDKASLVDQWHDEGSDT